MERVVFEVDDVRVLELLNNPTRLRILQELQKPITAREVAARLDVPVTRLYYHLDLLEDVGVIEVVEVKKAGAMLQRVYQAVATEFVPVKGLLKGNGDTERVVSAAVGVALDGARVDATQGLLDQLRPDADPQLVKSSALGRSVVRMSKDNAEKIVKQIESLVEEMADLEDEGEGAFAFSYTFFPMVGPVKGETS